MTTALYTLHRDYVTNFPSDVPRKAVQGFIATAAISLIAGNAANVAFIGGAISATATVIEAIMRPLIKAIFPKNPSIAKAIQLFIPETIALGLAKTIVPWINTTYEIVSFILRLLAWNALNEKYEEKNTGMAMIL